MLLPSSRLHPGGSHLRIAVELHEPPIAAAVRRLLENSGKYEIAWTPTTGPRSPSAADPDLLLILGGTASARVRIGEHRRAGWSKGLAVAAADARPEAAVACLDAGADDYIRLPLDSTEFLSRVRAVARRANPATAPPAAVGLDEAAYVATIGDWRASFTKTSFRLFAYLAERRGQWRSPAELQANVLKACCREGASNVRWHVLEARRALGPMRWCVHGDSRRGYMFDMRPCGLSHCHRELG